jgi:hypothetical protein
MRDSLALDSRAAKGVKYHSNITHGTPLAFNDS